MLHSSLNETVLSERAFLEAKRLLCEDEANKTNADEKKKQSEDSIKEAKVHQDEQETDIPAQSPTAEQGVDGHPGQSQSLFRCILLLGSICQLMCSIDRTCTFQWS